ncbi:MFS transporter [Brevibacillus sp. GCM10020057]|uniref:MFS transporter n=1 Tax=Brevibacillus sp. GCM10020057 TaxID=3317327 RepID=UPI00363DAC3B
MNRNLKLLWSANTLSVFGTAVYSLALTLLSIEYSQSALGAGAILFTSVIPYFFLGIIAGVICDRVERKPLMLFCDILRGGLTLSIPIADAFGVLTIHQIVIIGFLMTCIRAFFFPANQASVPLLIDDKKNLTKVNAYIGSTQNLGIMLGPSLGGVLLLFDFNVTQLLYIDSATYFISAILISNIRFPKSAELKEGSKKPTVLQDSWKGIKYMTVGNKEILIMILAFSTQLLVGAGVIQLGIPKVLEEVNLGGTKTFGFVMSIIALSSMLSSLWLARRKVGEPARWIFSGYFVRGCAFFVLGFSGNIIGIGIAALLMGFGNTISGTTLTTVLQLRTPNEMLGKVMAVRSSVGNIADAFAYLLLGSVLSTFSLTLAFTIVTIYVVVTTGAFYLLWRNYIHKKSIEQIKNNQYQLNS